jgi:hypothetical protein
MKDVIIEELRTANIAIYEEEKVTVELASYPGTVSRFLGSKRFPSKAINETPLKNMKVYIYRNNKDDALFVIFRESVDGRI